MQRVGGGGSSAVAAATAWFEVDARAFDVLTDQLERQHKNWVEASAEVARIFHRISSGVTWEGAASRSAQEFKAEQQRMYADAERATSVARDSVDGFAEVLRSRQRLIDDALCDRERAARQVSQAKSEVASLESLESSSSVAMPDTQAARDQVLLAERAVLDCDERLLRAVSLLESDDAELAEHLKACVRILDDVAAQQRGSRWLGSMTTPAMAMTLGVAQFKMNASDAALWKYVMESGDRPLETEKVRELLGQVEDGRRLRFVGATPAVAEALSRDRYSADFLKRKWPERSIEAKFFGAIAPYGGFPAKPDEVAVYSGAVASSWAKLSAADRAYLIALYPGVIGTTRGIDPKANYAANRIAIAGAKHRSELMEKYLKSRNRAQAAPLDKRNFTIPNHVEFSKLGYYEDVLTYGWETIGDAEDFHRARRELYENMLNARFSENPQGGIRQFLYFNPDADGSATEVVGSLSEGTENVGIFVPGTGSDIMDFKEGRNIESAKGFLSPYDPQRNAVILELGFDAPDKIELLQPNAMMNHYSVAAAPAVLSTALTVRKAAPEARSTMAGHSYGGAVVGVADKVGLPVNRVVHISSAGSGKGVNSLDDLQKWDIQGNSRLDENGNWKVQRFSMTPMKDQIALSQGVSLGPVGHGADTDDLMPNVKVGNFKEEFPDQRLRGKPIDDPLSHLESDLDELRNEAIERVYNKVNPKYEHRDLHEIYKEIDELEKALARYKYKMPHVATHKPGTDSAERVGQLMFGEIDYDAVSCETAEEEAGP